MCFFQLSSPDASLCSVLMEVLLKNQPEGVQLSVKEVSVSRWQNIVFLAINISQKSSDTMTHYFLFLSSAHSSRFPSSVQGSPRAGGASRSDEPVEPASLGPVARMAHCTVHGKYIFEFICIYVLINFDSVLRKVIIFMQSKDVITNIYIISENKTKHM